MTIADHDHVFSIVPLEAIQDHRLGLIELRVLVTLLSFRGKNTNTIWPHRSVIAERAGYSELCVSRAISGLVAKGWLVRQQHRGPNTYQITVPETVSDPDTVTSSDTVSDQVLNSARLGAETVSDPGTPKLTRTDHLQTKRETRTKKPAFVAPTLDEVHTYAKAKEAPWCAKEFWNHFEANGWLVSGRSKMANWHRAFDNWVIRDKRFEADREQRARGFR